MLKTFRYSSVKEAVNEKKLFGTFGLKLDLYRSQFLFVFIYLKTFYPAP